MTPQTAGHLAMLCFSALVAGSFALGSMIADQVSPLVVTALRFVITVAFLGGLVLLQGKPKRQDFVAPWRFLAVGACLAFYFVFMFKALIITEPVSLSVVFTLAPLASGIFGFILLGQLFTRRVSLALLVGAIGAIWVIFHGDMSRMLLFQPGWGEILFFVGMLFYALYAPLVRMLKRRESLISFTFGATFAALILILPMAYNDLRDADFSAFGPLVWPVIFYLAIFASALTLTLIQFASLRLPAVKVMAHTYLVPSWVILWQLALNQGTPNTTDLIGVILTIVALLLLLKNQDAKPVGA